MGRREIERYDRQMMIRGWGHEAQAKLKLASVVVAGLGGLGCPAAIYLCAAGVGRIRMIDKERVDLNNLNRQILYWERDVGRYKAEVAPALMKEFGYQNVMQVPSLEKIVVNMGVSAELEKTAVDDAAKDLSLITGRKPAVSKSR